MNSRVIMDELRRIWKTAVVAYYKALLWSFPKLDKENHETPGGTGRCKDWNLGPIKQLLEVPTVIPHSILCFDSIVDYLMMFVSSSDYCVKW
jgi:hypothetical protein